MVKLLPSWDTDNVESLRPFSRISLIVADLDGTLLKPRDTQLYEKIGMLRASLGYYRYKVRMTIATGRTLWGVRPLLEKLSLDKEMPVILCNGSILVKNRSFATIFRRTISAQSLSVVLEVTSGYRVRTLAYAFNDPALANQALWEQGPHEYMLGWTSINPIKYDFNNMIINWQSKWKNERDVCPSAILIDISEDPNVETTLLANLRQIQDISIHSAKPQYIEVRPKECNKGAALERAISSLGLSLSDVLAFGDDDNDAEMLELAGIGVAVSGASVMAENHSDYICRHTVEAGAIEVLRLVRNARRYYFTKKVVT